MAFDLGQRVTSTFTGPGTVSGELFKDDGDAIQYIRFDNPTLGERPWSVKKLTPLDEEVGSGAA
jgi:hypothetical protein